MLSRFQISIDVCLLNVGNYNSRKIWKYLLEISGKITPNIQLSQLDGNRSNVLIITDPWTTNSNVLWSYSLG